MPTHLLKLWRNSSSRCSHHFNRTRLQVRLRKAEITSLTHLRNSIRFCHVETAPTGLKHHTARNLLKSAICGILAQMRPAVQRHRIGEKRRETQDFLNQMVLNCRSESFNFKKLLGFTSFFKDPVRLANRTYRAWGENSIEKWTIE